MLVPSVGFRGTLRVTMAHAPVVLLLLMAFAAPVRAESQTADLNADGIPDRIQIDNTASSATLRVRLSGQPGLIVIRAAEPISSVRAADVDRDGALDIVAVSSTRHVWTWRNGGQGRFRLMRKGLRRLVTSPTLRTTWQPHDDPAAAPRDELRPLTPMWSESVAVTIGLGAGGSTPLLPPSPAPSVLSDAVAARAPPASLS